MIKITKIVGIVLLCVQATLVSRDILLEWKTAYFLPTDSYVKDIYGKGTVYYGPEATFLLSDKHNWYGFASVDFLSKKGRSLGLSNYTKMNIVALGFGLKYFVPFCYGDFYAGLGVQPLHLKTINCFSDTVNKTSKWGVGGSAKIGSYIDLPRNLFVDLFVDYSFVKVGCDSCCTSTFIPLRANMSGCLFGIGLGYRFN